MIRSVGALIDSRIHSRIFPFGACLRIVADIVILDVAPEVLPLITTHDVEVILGIIIEVMIILSISRELQVALQNLFVTSATIIDRASVPRLVVGILDTFRNISTKSYMQAQVFEAVNLIVDVGTSYERLTLGIFVTSIKQS